MKMTLDALIEKYGMHELDVDFCKKIDNEVLIYTYCHEHDVGGKFMLNHFLEIRGNLTAIEKEPDDEDDIFIHIAWIEKCDDGTYEIIGVGGRIHFSVEGELLVKELTQGAYDEQLNLARKHH